MSYNRYKNYTVVDNINDLPNPINSVISLSANTTYFFTNNIDINNNRLVCNENTVLIGGSSENSSIRASNLAPSSPLITSNYSLPIRHITLTHNLVLDLDATGHSNQALDWLGVNFTNSPIIGRIKNYENFILTDSAFLNSANLTFDGSISTIGATNCLFNISGGTGFILPSSTIINRRFRLIYSSFIVTSGNTGIDISTGATIPTEGFILDTINFAGNGEYIKATGVQYNDNKSLFLNNKGVLNSAEIGCYYMSDNLIVTPIISAATPTKILGTTTASTNNQKFTHSNNRLTYTGVITRDFRILAITTFTAGASSGYSIFIYKNGQKIIESTVKSNTSAAGRAENVSCQCITQMTTNDYIEVWIQSNVGTQNVTIDDLNVICISIN